MFTCASTTDPNHDKDELCKYTIVLTFIKIYLQRSLLFEVDLLNPVGESCGDNIMEDVEMVEYGLDVSVLGKESTEHKGNTVAVQSSKSNVIVPLILFYCKFIVIFCFLISQGSQPEKIATYCLQVPFQTRSLFEQPTPYQFSSVSLLTIS